MARPSLERIWAESPTQFEEPTDAVWTLGWEGGADKDPPEAKWENWWHNRVDQLLRQIERDGAMEWLAVTPYNKWAMVSGSDGDLYLAIQSSTGVDPVSDDGTYWLTVPEYIKRLFNAQGSAPLFGVRAWANFNGENLTIRSSGNIDSISRISNGVYQVLFQNDLNTSSYCVNFGVSQNSVSGPGLQSDSASPFDLTQSGFKIESRSGNDDTNDLGLITFSVVG